MPLVTRFIVFAICATSFIACAPQKEFPINHSTDPNSVTSLVSQSPQTTETETEAEAESTVHRSSTHASRSLLIMSYNLHNMFDTQHDIQEGVDKNDSEFLPRADCIALHRRLKSECQNESSQKRTRSCIKREEKKIELCKKGKFDWTPGKFALKMKQIKAVFDLRKKANKENRYPDLVAFSEIENSNVTAAIAQDLGYSHYVTTNGRDRRGIDLALMYQPSSELKKESHTQHHIESIEDRFGYPTRPILEVKFEYKGKPLFVYVNHWPSQRSPTISRSLAARKLRELIEKRYQEDPESAFIAMGDFNTNEETRRKPGQDHPFDDVLLKGTPTMKDAKAAAVKAGHKVAPGSYFYDGWLDLDRFFVSENLLNRGASSFTDASEELSVDLSSFNIFNHPEISETCNPRYCDEPQSVPKRYDHYVKPGQNLSEVSPGFSDHYPIYVKIQ